MTTRITFSLVRSHLRFTGRRTPHPNKIPIPLVRIARGAHLELAFLESFDDMWAKRRVVEIAQLLAVGRLRPSCVAVGRSALLVHGLDVPEPLPDEEDTLIVFAHRHGRSRNPLDLPAVVVDGKIYTAARTVRFIDTAHTRTPTVQRHGIRIQRIDHALVTASFIHPPRMAFVLACLGYRAILGLNSDQRPSPAQTRVLRRKAFTGISALPDSMRSIRQATRILTRADPGCESVGEAWLLWILIDAGISDVRTQVRVDVSGHRFYIDIAIPGLRLAIEFDGRRKYGTSLDEVHRSAEAERRRERYLIEAGWTVIRFRWSDLHKCDEVARQVLRIVEVRGRDNPQVVHSALKSPGSV